MKLKTYDFVCPYCHTKNKKTIVLSYNSLHPINQLLVNNKIVCKKCKRIIRGCKII